MALSGISKILAGGLGARPWFLLTRGYGDWYQVVFEDLFDSEGRLAVSFFDSEGRLAVDLFDSEGRLARSYLATRGRT